MSFLRIKGGRRLEGEVRVSGAKNAALPILAGVIMLEGETVLSNVPHLKDTRTMLKMLKALGIRAEFHKDNVVKIWNEKKILCR